MKRARFSPAQIQAMEKKYISISAGVLFVSTLIYFLYALYLNMVSNSANDFRAFYTAGLMVRHGFGHDLYSLERQYSWQKSFIQTLPNRKYLLAFLNPPFVALLMVPFTFLSEGSAYMLWGLVNIIMLFIVSGIVNAVLSKSGWVKKYATIAAILLFIPVWESMLEGQFSLLLLLCLLIAWLMLRKRKYFLAGLALSVLICKPQLMILPALIMLWKTPKVLTGIACGVLFCFLLSIFTSGGNFLTSYVPFLIGITKWHDLYGIHPQQQNSWSGVLYAFIPAWHVFFFILWILGDGFALFILYLCWKGETEKTLDLAYALLVAVTLFTSPHVNFHDISLLVIPSVVIVLYTTSRAEEKRLSGFLYTSLIIGYVGIFIDYLFLWFHVYIHLTVFLMIGLILLLAMLIRREKDHIYEKTR